MRYGEGVGIVAVAADCNDSVRLRVGDRVTVGVRGRGRGRLKVRGTVTTRQW